MDRQTLRDRVRRCNVEGVEGLFNPGGGGPRRATGNEWNGLPTACWLPPGAAPLFGNHGSFPAGTACGCYVPHLPMSACRFFAFRFVSDFRRRQPIVTIQENFSDGSSETKWPSPPKRNALPKRAGKPPEGSRRNLRDTGGEKIVGRSGMASGKKTFARRDALRSCTRNSRTRSADQVRQIAASIRVSGFTGPVLFAGGNTIIAGTRPCAMARAGGIARPRVSSV